MTDSNEFNIDFYPPYVGSAFSPTIDVDETETALELDITDKNGEKTVSIPKPKFGEVTVSVDETGGTPDVEVSTSGTVDDFNIDFSFSGLKGEPGELNEVTASASTLPYSADATASAELDAVSGSIAFDFGIPQGNPPTDGQVTTAVDEWLVAHPEATTTVQDGSITNEKLAQSGGVLSEVEDIRTGYDGTTYPTAGDAVREQVENLRIGKKTSTNLIDMNRVTRGKYVNYSNGNLVTNNDYMVSDYLPVTAGKTLHALCFKTSVLGSYYPSGISNQQVAFYDADKTYISGLVKCGYDIEIPNEDLRFGILERAQALGDLEALVENNRRVIRVRFRNGLPKKE